MNLRHERHHRQDDGHRTAWIALGTLAVAGIAGAGWLARQRQDGGHPPDSAPGRTAKRQRFGGFAVTGRTVTIDRPRQEIYSFWRDFSHLPEFMDNIDAVETLDGGLTRWRIKAPMGTDVSIETRIVTDRPGDMIAWRSVEGSQVETEGKVTFRDAPGDRGTEVEAIIAWKPPAGAIGQMIAKMFQRDPRTQGRRELKRLKMLMETGEIATSRNRRD